jgi:hypothetical protein
MDSLSTDIAVSSDVAAERGGRIFILTPCISIDDVKTIIAGHSHSGYVSRALVRSFPDNPEFQVVGLAKELGFGGLRGGAVTAEYLKTLSELGAARNIALVWTGNQHNAAFLLEADGPIDLIPRDYPNESVLPDATIVAESVIRAHFQPSLEGLGPALASLSSASKHKRMIVATPPPLFDEHIIRKRLKGEPGLTAQAIQAGLELCSITITPASVRRKLWFVLQRMMAEIGELHNALYVPVPEEAMDEQGCLRPDLSAGDVTHAGPVYGAMMVRQIARALAESGTQRE